MKTMSKEPSRVGMISRASPTRTSILRGSSARAMLALACSASSLSYSMLTISEPSPSSFPMSIVE